MMKSFVIKARRQQAFSVIELIVTIAILAILLTMAVPALQDIIKNNRITGQTNELVALIQMARNEAIRRHADINDDDLQVVLRLDANGATWTGNISVTGGDTAPGCPAGVIRCTENNRVLLSGSTSQLVFDSRGYLAGAWRNEFICLRHEEPCNGDRQHRVVQVFPSGRIENRARGCNDACPGVD